MAKVDWKHLTVSEECSSLNKTEDMEKQKKIIHEIARLMAQVLRREFIGKPIKRNRLEVDAT